MAPLEATVALGLLVARAPRGAQDTGGGPWPVGHNEAHRLLLRARASEGGTRLPPHHRGVTEASFPPQWGEVGRRWSSFARRVGELEGENFQRVAELLGGRRRPRGRDVLVVHWAYGASRALARSLRLCLQDQVVLEPARAPESLPCFAAQDYAFGALGVGARPPLLTPLSSTDEQLSATYVPDLVAPTAWAVDASCRPRSARRVELLL